MLAGTVYCPPTAVNRRSAPTIGGNDDDPCTEHEFTLAIVVRYFRTSSDPPVSVSIAVFREGSASNYTHMLVTAIPSASDPI